MLQWFSCDERDIMEIVHQQSRCGVLVTVLHPYLKNLGGVLKIYIETNKNKSYEHTPRNLGLPENGVYLHL